MFTGRLCTFLLIVIVVITIATACGQENGAKIKKLGLLKFKTAIKSEIDLGEDVAVYIASHFYSDTYTLVERVDLQPIYKEKLFQKEVLDKSDFREIKAVDYLLLGTITREEKRWQINYRCVALDGKIAHAGSVVAEKWRQAKVLLTQSLLLKLNKAKYCRLWAREFEDSEQLEALKTVLNHLNREKKIKIVDYRQKNDKTFAMRLFLIEGSLLEFGSAIKNEVEQITVTVKKHEVYITPAF